MTHVTFRLTAKNQDQLQNPMLGNRQWATFFVLLLLLNYALLCHILYNAELPFITNEDVFIMLAITVKSGV